jgi:hypothetical protein
MLKKTTHDQCPPRDAKLDRKKCPSRKGEVKRDVQAFGAFEGDYRVVHPWVIS